MKNKLFSFTLTFPLRSITFLFLVSHFAFSSASEPITFFMEDEPVYTSDSEASPGFLREVVKEMALRMKIQPVEKFLPWKRAQQQAINTTNGVIFPLTRTVEREPHYNWICKVFDVPVMFINKKGHPIINSAERAKQLKSVATIIGTPQEAKLKKFGITRIVAVKAKLLTTLLENDHVPAIYTARPEAAYAWRQGNHQGSLQYGATLQTLPLWIASSKNADLIDNQAWNKALQEVKDAGIYDALFNKYFGE